MIRTNCKIDIPALGIYGRRAYTPAKEGRGVDVYIVVQNALENINDIRADLKEKGIDCTIYAYDELSRWMI